VQLRLRGASTATRRVNRTANPFLRGTTATVVFSRLSPGSYRLTGWYGGDSVREPSSRHTETVTLRCG
jgi:hypothetical protein